MNMLKRWQSVGGTMDVCAPTRAALINQLNYSVTQTSHAIKDCTLKTFTERWEITI